MAELIRTYPAVMEAYRDQKCVRDVHCEVKVVCGDDGRWQLDRFYWSLQTSEASSHVGFGACTLTYAAKTGKEHWQCFPCDSYLAELPRWHGEASHMQSPNSSITVLRYVPLRRFTFRQRNDRSDVIGKMKRKSRYKQAWATLGLVADAIDRARVPFRVSHPVELNDSLYLYTQSVLPGRDLVGLIDSQTAAPLLHQVGILHSALHRVRPPGSFLQRSNSVWLAASTSDVEMIDVLGPTWANLSSIPLLLREQLPADRELAFCHGDFVCSQLLVAPDRWGITDFDLCHAGDPYRDIAMLIASLPYDVPGFDTQAYSSMAKAYLEGYREECGHTLDERRLCWHRICAELYYMALALRKGRHTESMFELRGRTVLDLARQLAER